MDLTLQTKPEEREPDDDLESAYGANPAAFPYPIEDISAILASDPGHNDDDNWYWVVRFKNSGALWLVTAWCDYSGWGCQDGAHCYASGDPKDIEILIRAIAESEIAETKKAESLIAQLEGRQPFGTSLPTKAE